eukprot:5025189-Prymnesium_polylepis.1
MCLRTRCGPEHTLEAAGRRMVKDERVRQIDVIANCTLELIPELYGTKRVKTRFHQRRVSVDIAT